MPSRVILVPTDIAALFVARCRHQQPTQDQIRAAREHVYYLAKQGKLTRHGAPKRGRALWDLVELAEPYRQGTTIVLP